jgi:hypothetical protein
LTFRRGAGKHRPAGAVTALHSTRPPPRRGPPARQVADTTGGTVVDGRASSLSQVFKDISGYQ